jgi:hypothetical protein
VGEEVGDDGVGGAGAQSGEGCGGGPVELDAQVEAVGPGHGRLLGDGWIGPGEQTMGVRGRCAARSAVVA